jgi:UDP-N-acetylglucosamine--N-acetylmuramyl-(pentapeptide) pyrophosphoryl-undecaprenol N-acetylglucosamine transferase
MGGFTSFAPILAGRKRKAPTFVHESNAIPGKANKLNARFCTAVLLGFEECAVHFPKANCITTGTPVRGSLANKMGRAEACGVFGLGSERKTVLIMGGSQGAHGINVALKEALPTLGKESCQVIHLTGAQDEAMMREAYAAAGIPAFVAAFSHRMEASYAAADLAVARSGAASLTELSHFGLPSILIPYPFAAEDHQTFNAKIFERGGAAILLSEKTATSGALAENLRQLLEAPARLKEMSAHSAALSPKNAAERVAEVILAQVKP